MTQSTTNFPVAPTKYTAKTKLFPFQRESVERAKQMNKGRCFLAHEQGLGKTLMAITFIIETNSFPAVVICPRILKDIWAQEFKTHYGKEVTILKGTKPPVAPLPDDNDRVYIINYDIVHAWEEKLLELRPKILILDECQKVKNHATRWTRSCNAIARATDKFLALSGTPMTSKPTDLYMGLFMITKGHIISRAKFRDRYTLWRQDRYGEHIIGPKNAEELHRELRKNYMIRYKIDDVIKDLPKYTRQTTLVEMTPREKSEYTKIRHDFENWLRENYPDRYIPRSDMGQVLQQFQAMRIRIAEWKVPCIQLLLDNFLESNDGKIVTFGLHHKLLDRVASIYERQNKPNEPLLVRIDGRTPQRNRIKAVDDFQKGPARVFLGQMETTGLGLTLTAAHHCLFTELDFMPANHLQAEARVRRIGTKAAYLNYNYIVMKDTIDETIANRLFHRQQAINQVIDGMTEENEPQSDNLNVLGGVLHEQFGYTLA